MRRGRRRYWRLINVSIGRGDESGGQGDHRNSHGCDSIALCPTLAVGRQQTVHAQSVPIVFYRQKQSVYGAVGLTAESHLKQLAQRRSVHELAQQEHATATNA